MDTQAPAQIATQDAAHEQAYASHLVSQGVAPDLAEDLARRLRSAQQLPPVDLVGKTKISRQQHRLSTAGVQIDQGAPDADDLAFMHTVLCQVGLPRRAVEGASYERVSGGVGIQITAGSLWDGERFVQHPVPYGPMPRIVLAHLNSEALRQKSPEVDVGPSASAFLKTLGYRSTGGQRGSYTAFKKQVQALAACTVRIGYNVGDKAYTFNRNLIDDFAAWTHRNTPGEARVVWPESIRFSDRYFESLQAHAVPLDMRALHALRGSALSLDLYMMLAERLHRLDKPLLLHWSSLREQFGHDYTGSNAAANFKTNFLAALKKVKTVYPQAKVRVVKTGVSLRPSPTPVTTKRIA